MEKLVSIIVPVYNVENCLKKCVDSIISQKYNNLEIILVDDGATDKSGAICDELALTDKRIRVLHKQNGGLSSARNAGLKIATGLFVMFIDSDDWIKQGMVSDLYKTLIQGDADLAVCGVIMTDGIKEVPLEWYKKRMVFQTDEALDELIDNQILTSHAWNKIYKYEIIKDVPFPEGKLYEDIRMMHFVVERCRKVAVTDKRYYYYYQRPNSITTLPKLKNKLEFVDAFEDRYNALKDKYPQYKEKILSQIGGSFSLTIVQNRFSKEQINDCKDQLNKRMLLLKREDVSTAIKKCSSKKNYLFYLLARTFGIRANSIYQIYKKVER